MLDKECSTFYCVNLTNKKTAEKCGRRVISAKKEIGVESKTQSITTESITTRK